MAHGDVNGHNGNNNKYVLKILNREEYKKDNHLFKKLERESRIHSFLNHENIVKRYDTLYTEDNIIFVLENCENGDLINYMKRCGQIFINRKITILKNIIDSLAYMHERNIVHRDIKPDNIFIDRYGNAKIGDFGCCEVTTEHLGKRGSEEYCGTLYYIAPEILKAVLNYNDCKCNDIDLKKCDIWSFGILAFILATGKFPWKTLESSMAENACNINCNINCNEEDEDDEKMNEEKIIDEIINFDIVIPEYLPFNIAELISLCCARDPEKRPTAQQLQNLPLFDYFVQLSGQPSMTQQQQKQKQTTQQNMVQKHILKQREGPKSQQAFQKPCISSAIGRALKRNVPPCRTIIDSCNIDPRKRKTYSQKCINSFAVE